MAAIIFDWSRLQCLRTILKQGEASWWLYKRVTVGKSSDQKTSLETLLKAPAPMSTPTHFDIKFVLLSAMERLMVIWWSFSPALILWNYRLVTFSELTQEMSKPYSCPFKGPQQQLHGLKLHCVDNQSSVSLNGGVLKFFKASRTTTYKIIISLVEFTDTEMLWSINCNSVFL